MVLHQTLILLYFIPICYLHQKLLRRILAEHYPRTVHQTDKELQPNYEGHAKNGVHEVVQQVHSLTTTARRFSRANDETENGDQVKHQVALSYL